MKTQTLFQRGIVGILVVLCSHAARAAPSLENQRQLDKFTEMTEVLKNDGLEAFLTKGRERLWMAPKMYSAWFVNKLPDDPDGKKLVELAKNALGHEIARQMSPVAKAVRETKKPAMLEAQGEVLFAAIAWLDSETAYANMLLQQRAYDIASVAATKLMCDINYPMEKAEKAMKRLDDLSWGSPEKSRVVLFEESGGSHFVESGPVITREKLDQEFRVGVSLVIKLGSIADRPDLEIFAREDYKRGECRGDIDNMWSKREHINFAQRGFGSVNLENLVHLHEFRRRYGRYPTKPETIRPYQGESPIKAAFREISWENPYGIGGAWATFEAYLNGRLVDEVFQATDRHFNPQN
jgi:hypothetical protein